VRDPGGDHGTSQRSIAPTVISVLIAGEHGATFTGPRCASRIALAKPCQLVLPELARWTSPCAAVKSLASSAAEVPRARIIATVSAIERADVKTIQRGGKRIWIGKIELGAAWRQHLLRITQQRQQRAAHLAARACESRLTSYGLDQNSINAETFIQAYEIFTLFQAPLDAAQNRRTSLLREIRNNRSLNDLARQVVSRTCKTSGDGVRNRDQLD
jgi:hypothetical protein